MTKRTNKLHLPFFKNVFIHNDSNDSVLNDNGVEYMPLPSDYCPDFEEISRVSKDNSVCNSNGVKLLELCRETGVRIVNGRVGSDKNVGQFTCVNFQGRSLLDYILSPKPMFNLFDTFIVHDPSVYSDHCMLSLTLSLVFERFTIESNEVPQFKCVWQETDFVEKLTCDKMVEKLATFERKILNCSNVNTDFINDIVLEFTNVINDIFSRNISHKIDPPKDNRINMSWCSEECEDRRQDILRLLNEYRQNDSNENRKRMVQARKLFKSCARKCRLNHDKEQTTRLLANKHNNVKAYWKLLKGASNTNDPNISCSEFANNFKCVNNPTSPFFNPDEDVV